MAETKLWHLTLLAALIVGAISPGFGFASAAQGVVGGSGVGFASAQVATSGLLMFTWVILLWVLIYKIFRE
ncbi:MAG TPA: hypothetical protein VJI67_01450 [archaeon]|nr:hypothetical protein [archaeon]HLD80405.1 hypothetical protein [archaeon]